jgi:hypothetical protein
MDVMGLTSIKKLEKPEILPDATQQCIRFITSPAGRYASKAA